MAGASEAPFKPGAYPMKELQWHAMTNAVAQLCAVYGIAVTPKTVLGHGEVQKTLKIVQNGKWDPMRLSFVPNLTPAQVGAKLRDEVAARLAQLQSGALSQKAS